MTRKTPAAAPENPARSRAIWALIAIAILFAVGIRVQGLGRKMYHHDESIHAWYSYRLYDQGRINDTNPSDVVYKYDPVYHGPVLYHVGALFFLLFGDTDATGRLPMAACGIFLLYLIWLLLGEERNSSRWWALALAGLSPTLIYYARFAVHDTYLATWYTGMALFGIRYWKTGKERDFFLCALFLGLMYCTKTNSYMHGFIIGFSAVLYGAIQWFRPEEERRAFLCKLLGERAALTQLAGLYALFSAAAFFYARLYYEVQLLPGGKYYNSLVINRDYLAKTFGGWIFPDSRQPASGAAKWFEAHWGGFSVFYWFVFIFVCVAFLVALALLRRSRWGDGGPKPPDNKEELRLAPPVSWIMEHWTILLSLAGLIVLYGFLFTTMFANHRGLAEGVRDYVSYWFGQNETHRLAGGPDYYFFRILLYDFPSLFLLFGGILWFCLSELKEIFIEATATPEKGGRGRAEGSSAFMWYLIFFVAGLVVFLLAIYAVFGIPNPNDIPPRPPMAGVSIFLWSLLCAALLYPYLRLWQRRPLPAFLILWALAGLVIYAKLGEKAPWLMTHQVLPLTLLAGVTLGDFLARVPARAWRVAVLAPLGVLLALQMRAALLLNVYYEDDAREAMVYVHTAPEVRGLLDEIAHLAQQSGMRKRFPIFVGQDANWPFVWYFRHYTTQFSARTSAVAIEHADPAGSNHQNMLRQLGDEFTWRKIRLQNWWDNPRPRLDTHVIPGQKYYSTPELRRLLVDYFLYRRPWPYKGQVEALGSKDIYVYFKRDYVDKPIQPVRRDLPAGSSQPMRLLPDAGFGQNGLSPVAFREPRGLSWSNGRLFVCDSKIGRVVILDASGAQIGQLGAGQISAEYSGASAVVGESNGGCWVADTWRMLGPDQLASRVVRFSPEGRIVREILGSPQEPFFAPRGLAVTAGGELVATDTGRHGLKVFSLEGQFLRAFGQFGSGPGAFSEPVGVVVGKDNTLYVADTGNRRIQQLEISGRFIRQWNVPGFVGEEAALTNIEPMLAVDGRGRLYVTDSSMDQLCVFTADGTNMQVYGVAGQLSKPKGVAVDEEGRIYISQTATGRVARFLPVAAP